jgi:phosphoglycerate dehydrogenase-like enzyme
MLPRAVVAMSPRFYPQHFDERRLARLRTLVDLDEDGPLTEFDSPEARARMADAEIVVGSWGLPAFTAERLAAMPKLRAVIYCAGTVRFFATPELWQRGITVTSAALANAVPVVEYTVAMVVLALKKALTLSSGADLAHNGEEGRGDLSAYERTVGIVGLSSIGRRVVPALRGLLPSTTFVAYDPYATAENTDGLGVELASLDEVCRRSAVLSIHAPDLPSTFHMIGAEQLALLPDHATVLNTARGRLLDHDALVAECRTGRLDAILDVTDPEPLPDDHPLRRLPNVILTPHIAGSRGTELRRMTDMALADLEAWLDGRVDAMVGRVDPATLGTSA